MIKCGRKCSHNLAHRPCYSIHSHHSNRIIIFTQMTTTTATITLHFCLHRKKNIAAHSSDLSPLSFTESYTFLYTAKCLYRAQLLIIKAPRWNRPQYYKTLLVLWFGLTWSNFGHNITFVRTVKLNSTNHWTSNVSRRFSQIKISFAFEIQWELALVLL